MSGARARAPRGCGAHKCRARIGRFWRALWRDASQLGRRPRRAARSSAAPPRAMAGAFVRASPLSPSLRAVAAPPLPVAPSPRRPRSSAAASPPPRRAVMSAPAPLFAAFCSDVPDSAGKRAAARDAHVEWIKSPRVATFFAGPVRDSPQLPFKGSLIVLAADDYDDARRKLAQDPYQTTGVFASTQLREWRCGMSSTPLPQLLFLVWCVDRPASLQLRADTRPKHLQWWRDSARKGIIGPFPCEGGANGTLIVCSGEDVDEVRRWAATDPYNQASLFQSVTVLALKNVIDNVPTS
ncbi:YCII-related protein [Gracilaria domingensis]|nr:YCII-related protein [Gracilaria domingensis]